MTFDPHGQRYSNSIDVGEEYDRALAEAEARATRAEVALAKYARHLDGCEAYIARPLDRHVCTCGLRRALEKP